MAQREIVYPDAKAEETFWKNITPNAVHVCWPWKGRINKSTGYGYMYIKGFGTTHAHRVSYMLHGGKLKKGEHVRHRCDRRDCVNPAHLVAGTAKDNFTDWMLRTHDEEKTPGFRSDAAARDTMEYLDSGDYRP